MFLNKKMLYQTHIIRENTDNAPVHMYIASWHSTLQRSLRNTHRNREHHNILCYLWTSAKPPQKEDIISNSKDFFNEIIFLEIPHNNQKINFWAIDKVYKIYCKLFYDINPEFLTLFSFERHYAIMLKIASERNVYITLGEEGTASYRYLVRHENYLLPNVTFKEHLQIIYKRYWENSILNWKIFRFNQIIHFIIQGFKNLYKTYCYIFNLENIHYFFVKRHHIYNVFCKPHKKFNELHLDYPNILEDYFIADKITYSEIPNKIYYDDDILDFINHCGYDSNSIFFASQLIWGIDNSVLYPYIINILESFCKEYKTKIIIKPHVNENYEQIKGIIKDKSDFFEIMPQCQYPMERIIYFTKPKAIISIGSSSLVYGKAHSPNTKFFSIAKTLYNMIKKNLVIEKRSQKFFDEIIPMMELFGHIEKV